MKLILPANQIPEGATVTKRTGESEYCLRRSLKMYTAGAAMKEIKADDGCVFLVGPSGNVNIHSGETELAWVVEENELYYWLDERQQGTPQ